MKSLGVFEAKTRFSLLIAEAADGKTTIVTKNGKPVAEVGPLRNVSDRRTQAVKHIRALRKRMKLGGLDIRDLINEGREI